MQLDIVKGEFLKSSSLISITPQGKTALKKSNFINIFTEHKTEIITKIKDKEPQTKYDIQQFAVNIILSMADEPFMQPLKQFVYSEGKPLTKVLYLAGIYVRDEYLKSEFNK